MELNMTIISLDKAAEILATLCMRLSSSPDRPLPAAESAIQEAPTWLLKANVTVFRHADRTPKQKLKLYSHFSHCTHSLTLSYQ
jgi:hypothetical protein